MVRCAGLVPPAMFVDLIHRLLVRLASLRLTVVLLALAMGLVFAATLAQRHDNIWNVQQAYFHSLIVLGDLHYFHLPMPGGYVVGTLIVLNLLAACVVTIRPTTRRLGVLVLHMGLIVLLLGQLATGLWAAERRMTIDHGQTASHLQDIHRPELLITLHTPGRSQAQVLSIGQRSLRSGRLTAFVGTNIQVQSLELLPHTILIAEPDPRATTGAGLTYRAIAQRSEPGNHVDMPSGYVRLVHQGQTLGDWLVSWHLEPQTFSLPGGQVGTIELRPQQTELPFSLTLEQFTHQRYLGTQTPRQFVSDLRLLDARHGQDRPVQIAMNQPLRYGGYTFYQAGFANDDQTTILQVVENPAWLMPYLGCLLVTLGMGWHFVQRLTAFARRQTHRQTTVNETARPTAGRPNCRPVMAMTLWPTLAILAAGGYLMAAAWPAMLTDRDDALTHLAHLPVKHHGRVKPLDSAARATLMQLAGRQQVSHDHQRLTAMDWLAAVMTQPHQAADIPVFRIDHPGVRQLIQQAQTGRKRFSAAELARFVESITQHALAADRLPAEQRSTFDRQVLTLYQQLLTYHELARGQGLLMVLPDRPESHWQSLHDLAQQSLQDVQTDPAAALLLGALAAWHGNDANGAAQHLKAYRLLLADHPQVDHRVAWEVRFNRMQPYFHAMVLYLAVFLLACGALLSGSESWRASAAGLLGLTVVLHTVGIAVAMWLHGRPPVTNLYASAVFVAWSAAAAALIMEILYRSGVGSLAGAMAGFLSLLVAHQLHAGDNFEAVRAVLDSNFWLTVHVITIIIGYAGGFLAGGLGIVGIMVGLSRRLSEKHGQTLARMTYGTLCLALWFSFVGTVVGGIWADQSWGRFWGWDPKENGALLIVLIQAIALHARWCGLIGQRGLFVLAVLGNIVIAWAWFGVNMMDVGLHAYGSTEAGPRMLTLFVFSQLLIVAVGVWRAGRARRNDSRRSARSRGAADSACDETTHQAGA